MRWQGLVVLGCLLAGAAEAITVDGTRDAGYGAALFLQNTQTQFVDNTDASVGFANGSELDAGYAAVAGGRLYLFFAGNLESNDNKLDIFIDGAAGGFNALGSLTGNPDNFNSMTGLTFDAGFTANHWLTIGGGGATPTIAVRYANLVADQSFVSGQTTPTVGALSGGAGPVIEATWNNANTAGVLGGTGLVSDAEILSVMGVTTGIELSIALSDLGYVDGDIRIAAFVNNPDHNYASNQVAGVGILSGNLAGDGFGTFTGNLAAVDFNDFYGNQFMVIPASSIPEPASLVLFGVAGMIVGIRRRR